MNSHPFPLPDLATLYVAAAMHPDGQLSDAEVRRIIDLISVRVGESQSDLSDRVVLGALEAFPRDQDAQGRIVGHVARTLSGFLNDQEKEAVLSDIGAIASSDGIVLTEERTFVEWLANLWEVESPPTLQPIGEPLEAAADIGTRWGDAHDLALIYLGLAHGTDDELSRTEIHAMVHTLAKWLPEIERDEILETLRVAMERYAEGPREILVEQAVERLGLTLDSDQRRRALADLVRIANADGIFLDTEEDLIVHLQTEWKIDPDALYD